MRITAKARVQVVLEVEASSWGEDCQIKQLFDQAADSGIRQIRAAIGSAKGIQIVGAPKVIGVITENP